jgi:hypothetical protein
MMDYVTVPQVAKALKISERRVRKLLTDKRMKGFKRKDGTWLISIPLQIKPGNRGPELKSYPSRI